VVTIPFNNAHRTEKFVQTRVGLHDVCLRARERGDVDEIYVFLKTIGAKIVHPPEDGPWAPGYYSVLFEDPDGIRLEVNHVPGKGLLA
jgi:catechol 2,3-dioxygenase-like lactoylglutathione lyase family enzyme